MTHLKNYCGLPFFNVITCVLNQFHEHRLLNDALHFVIFMNLKLKKEHEVVLSFDSLMEDDYGVVDDLALLAFNIKREFHGILYFFLSFLKKYERNKGP